jgi:hypothetical protein
MCFSVVELDLKRQVDLMSFSLDKSISEQSKHDDSYGWICFLR